MATLRLLNGTRRGEEVLLRGEVLVVGRSPDCDVQLAEPEVSSRHARLQRRGHRWSVEDLESTNGTRVNDVEVGRAVLEEGDHLAFGPVIAVFRASAVESEPGDSARTLPPATTSTDAGNAAPDLFDELTLHEPLHALPADASSVDTDQNAAPRMESLTGRALSRDAAIRIQRLLDRTRRDAEALDAWVSDCALFVRALRLVDWTRLEAEQQRMIRELVDETEPESVLRNMRASIASARESLRLATAAAQAVEATADESPLPLRLSLMHARALAETDTLPLTPVHGCEDEVLPLPPEATIRLLRLLATIAERLEQGLALRVSEDATGVCLRVEGAPPDLALLCEEALLAVDAFVSSWMGKLTLVSEPHGSTVEIRLPA